MSLFLIIYFLFCDIKTLIFFRFIGVKHLLTYQLFHSIFLTFILYYFSVLDISTGLCCAREVYVTEL